MRACTVAILTGRYELVHCGHVETIRREAANYGFLIVYVVDNPDSAIPSAHNAKLLEYCVKDLYNVAIVLSPVHFGHATEEDLKSLPKHHAFLSANPRVTEHMRKLGTRVVCIEPTPGYSSSEMKKRIAQEVTQSETAQNNN